VKLKKDTYVQKNQTIPWDYIIYAICLDNDVEVGRIVFRYGTNEQLKYCGHIGYHIDEIYRGHGYAYQGLCLLMPLLYDEGFRQLKISVAYHNIASQKTVEKLPIITLEYAGGMRDISHNMAFAPVPDSLATKRAVLDILGQIDLQQLCVNLEATSTLMDIAYNACNGIVGAHQKLYELRTDVYQATVRSVKLADEFSSVSGNILSALVKVYKLIASGNAMKLGQVGTYLSRISKLAEGMSEAAAKMAKDFDDLSDRTLKQGSEVVAVENENISLK